MWSVTSSKRGGRALEEQHGADVHVRDGALLSEERGVHRREPVTVLLRHCVPSWSTAGREPSQSPSRRRVRGAR